MRSAPPRSKGKGIREEDKAKRPLVQLDGEVTGGGEGVFDDPSVATINVGADLALHRGGLEQGLRVTQVFQYLSHAS